MIISRIQTTLHFRFGDHQSPKNSNDVPNNAVHKLLVPKAAVV
jgi:hypothetical protein